ncbi:hypothetical protein J6590_006175 [Homalodisca vitripennis]|nr:hypothetical protein J6590_006175 [Homalodisca vitripennis]
MPYLIPGGLQFCLCIRWVGKRITHTRETLTWDGGLSLIYTKYRTISTHKEKTSCTSNIVQELVGGPSTQLCYPELSTSYQNHEVEWAHTSHIRQCTQY